MVKSSQSELSKNGKYKIIVCTCECSCGNLCKVLKSELRKGSTKSCGSCQRNSYDNFKDLEGKRLGKIKVVKIYKGEHNGIKCTLADCECECSDLFTLPANALTSKKKTSKKCGQCYQLGFFLEGLSKTTYYKICRRLTGIKTRCNSDHVDYGGRGISLFPFWEDRNNGSKRFVRYLQSLYSNTDLEHMFEKGYHIDRINVNGNYEPGNIRLVSPQQSANNKRNTLSLSIGLTNFSTKELEQKFNFNSKSIIDKRKKLGWNDVSAAFTPSKSAIEKVRSSFGLSMRIDMYQCRKDVATDISAIDCFITTFPSKISMELIQGPFSVDYHGKVDADKGISSFCFLAESNLVVHTFPDRENFVSFDLFSCKCFDPAEVIRLVTDFFGCGSNYQVGLEIRGQHFKRLEGYEYVNDKGF